MIPFTNGAVSFVLMNWSEEEIANICFPFLSGNEALSKGESLFCDE